MSRMGKMEMERYGGARWALEKVESIGLEAAKKEFERRGIQNAPLNIEIGEVTRFEAEVRDNVARTANALVCLTLHDEFGFGHDRLERFIARFNLKAECMNGDYLDWPDVVQMLKDECGIDIDLPVKYTNHPERYKEESA